MGSSFNPDDDFSVVYNSSYQTTQNDRVFVNFGKLTNTGENSST